jgi:uncharacterized protein
MQITPEVADILKYYVYVYSDPKTGKPFYIGKGKGTRVFEHLNDPQETDKTQTIQTISKAGSEPQIDILRYGLTELEAQLVEASAIDLIGISNLTNKIAGFDSRTFGRIGSAELILMLSAQEVDVVHDAVLITINKRYRSNMTEKELYESTRGVWVIGSRRDKAEYAMAVYQGIVREVYSIKAWYPAGTLVYETREPIDYDIERRWEFEGTIASDIRNQYVGKKVGKSGQNPIRYVNC